MSLEICGRHIVLPKTKERKEMELAEMVRRWQFLQKCKFYSEIRYAREIKEGLENYRRQWIPPERLVNVPSFSVQTLPFDDGSPFGYRKLLFNFGSFNSCRPISKDKFWFADNVLHNSDNMHPMVKEAIWEHQIIKIFEIADQQVNEQKKQGYEDFVMQSSQDSGSCSLTYPHHLQAIWLHDGVKPCNDYEIDKCVNISDMPKFLRRANDIKLLLNMRAVGGGKILVQGVYPLGHQQGELPVKPPINAETIIFWLRFMALRFGSVESFTNALSPNDLVIDYVNTLGAELVYDLNWIREYATNTHKQFDTRRLINNKLYRLILVKLGRIDLISKLNEEEGLQDGMISFPFDNETMQSPIAKSNLSEGRLKTPAKSLSRYTA